MESMKLLPWLPWLKGSRITTRTDLLNHLIGTFGYRDYLEIGVRDPRQNFNKVKVKGVAHGVDPAPRRSISHVMTSDVFFEQHTASGGKPYDLVLIDGLHLAEQVERDVVNSLANLTPNGTIVLHDCNPMTADAQTEHYDNKKHWNGTVWKAWVKLRATRADLAMWVIDIDEGCGVIRRGSQVPISVPSIDYADMHYAYLIRERRAALNLISVDDLPSVLRAAHSA